MSSDSIPVRYIQGHSVRIGPSRTRLTRKSLLLACLLAGWLLPLTLHAQSSSSVSSPGEADPNAPGEQDQTPAPRPMQRPYAIDPAGPAITLESSEPLFDIATALNACGYDAGLAESDPVRQHVRDDVNAALLASSTARDDRDALCGYIADHKLGDPGNDLAQYVSLAVYLTPELEPSVSEADMPPDANNVVNMLPQLRAFVDSVKLHTIWVQHRPEYEALAARIHDPLTTMILETNIYLKQPTSAYDGRSFLVLLEPMLSPAETNARLYGTDYIIVASPSKSAANADDADAPLSVRLDLIRHIYLHYELEPLIYSRASSMARLAPMLITVQDAPIDYIYKSDIVALVTECLIKAIEARTLEIPDAKPKPPASRERADQVAYQEQLNAYEKSAEILRREYAADAVKQGYVLTQYFYTQMQIFEHADVSLSENIGEMVYGMDVDREKHTASQVVFDRQGSSDVLRRVPQQLTGLDLAEVKLEHGDVDGAAGLVQKTLDSKLGDKDPDAARAHFMMARIETHEGLMDDAQSSFQQTIALSNDPRTTAWSHIYLGRIYDIQQQRDKALAEYRAALDSRDGRSDTKAAAEKGLSQPFSVPQRAQQDEDAPLDPTGKAQKDSYKPEPIVVPLPAKP
ncbi:MAG TPA: tetratricopeptide repeat protein [Acidobacteriaceae bacterium]|nr:tetratricopeptide repeat protein [Acidobacteriaceae bacterium]